MQGEGFPLVFPNGSAFGGEGAGANNLSDAFHQNHDRPNDDQNAFERCDIRIAEENAKQNGDDDHKRDGDEVKSAERLGFLHLSL